METLVRVVGNDKGTGNLVLKDNNTREFYVRVREIDENHGKSKLVGRVRGFLVERSRIVHSMERWFNLDSDIVIETDGDFNRECNVKIMGLYSARNHDRIYEVPN